MQLRGGRWSSGMAGMLLAMQSACHEPPPTDAEPSPLSPEAARLVALVRPEAVRGMPPPLPPPAVRPELVALGRALAFDRILSGNRSISCMTCHHPSFATTDGRSLPVGEAGTGVGPARTSSSATRPFIPRNAPALLNLSGQRSFFHDGRVEIGASGTLRTPAGAQLTAAVSRAFEFMPLSAVALFPVMDRDEMRGTSGNELAGLADGDFAGVWAALMRRLGEVPEYRAMFEAAYPGTPFDQMTFGHASNAIAGFLTSSLSFRRSPFDLFLAGDDRAVTVEQLRGARAFLSKGCATCHGSFAITNAQFANTGLPQVGPGMGNGPGGRDDFGRMNVTGQAFDRYRFRSPALRNVELTPPFGHAGQFASLSAFVRHYDNAARQLELYDVTQLEPALRGTLLATDAQLASTIDGRVRLLALTEQEISDITEFLRSLTDPGVRLLNRLVPARVPSGLPVDR